MSNTRPDNRDKSNHEGTSSARQRNPAKCPYAKKCGGCQLQHLPYTEQLSHKEIHVRKLIGKYCSVRHIIGMEDPYHYRNKVHAAFGYDGRSHRIVSGIYQPSTHRIVPVSDCLIEDKTADAIIADIRRLMPSFKLQAYDEHSGNGYIRHVLIRRGFTTGEVMVVIVAISPIFPAQKIFVKKLLELHPEIKTIVLNINDRFTSMVLGEKEKILYGKGYIEDKLCGLTFRISPKSFYQVNPLQTEILYKTAIDLADIKPDEIVMDAYCGIGTIGMIASSKAKRVVGVENNRDAVRDAIVNAKQNKLTNCWFTAADAGEYMAGMAEEGVTPDVVIMDPPRAGSDEKFLSSLLKLKPGRIVYVSCNPETLARDLDVLVRGDYRAVTAQPVDMFPHTEHVESCVLLERVSNRKADSYVKLNVKMEDYYRIKEGRKNV